MKSPRSPGQLLYGVRSPCRWVSGARWSAALVLLLGARALAGKPPSLEPIRDEAWSFGASLSWYYVPNDKNFGVLDATADHGPLHFELRYHDEAIGTASALIGWNFELGETVKLELTPLVGCLLGDEGGPIVGLLVELRWGPLSFTSQDEWVWAVQGGKGGLFYAWTELDVRPWHWARAGIVAQRTRLFHTAREVIFGPLVGFTAWNLDFSFYWFQPGGIDQTFSVTLEARF